MADEHPRASAADADEQKVKEWIEKIHYSDRYADDEFEYRHVILPKPLYKMIPKSYFNPDKPGVLSLLSEEQWRGIGITQSLGWVHYEVHAPEPHVLLFRRAKNFVPPVQPQHTVVNGRSGKEARRK